MQQHMLHAVDLRKAGQSGKAARDQKRNDKDRSAADAAKLCGITVVAYRADAEAQRRFVKQEPDKHSRKRRDQKAQMDPGARDDRGQVRIPADGVGLQVFRLGLLQDRAQQIVHQSLHNIGGHHTDKKFICAESGLCQTD